MPIPNRRSEDDDSQSETNVSVTDRASEALLKPTDRTEYAPIAGSRKLDRRPPGLHFSDQPVEREAYLTGLQVTAGLQTHFPEKKEKSISWMDLPYKSQLAILTISRLAEPLVFSSLRSYLFYQLKSFDRTLSDSTIASQAGLMQGCFALAQLSTALLWGRISDRYGRKIVLFVGLSGTCISCIGFGMAKTFYQAMAWRMLTGALNGNVGVMRTMISEIVREKKFQSRAFLLLPMCGNVGTIIGPILGGLLADPAKSYPKWFGGVQWLEDHPYAPPNFLSAGFILFALIIVVFGLDETHEKFAHLDYGRQFYYRMQYRWQALRGRHQGYTAIDSVPNTPRTPATPYLPPGTPGKAVLKRVAPRYRNTLSFRQIFTYNVICTLWAHGMLMGTIGTFTTIFYSYLSTPVFDPAANPNYTPYPPFIFTGGTGLSPRDVGFAMAILGTIGIILQVIVYPIINERLGTIRSWRLFLYCFPVAYILTPYLSLMPSTTPAPGPKSGLLFWFALCGILFLQRIGQTFAAPATTILINNCSPHPSVLGTIHGIGQSASSAARTVAPAIGGWVYGVGLEKGMVGLMFWILTIMAGLTCFASLFVREGDGHEIRLEGDDEAEEEADRINREAGFT